MSLRSDPVAMPSKTTPGLFRGDARMIHGLPDPQSPEAVDWIVATLKALQAREPASADPSAMLAAIEHRLAPMEALTAPLAHVDVVRMAQFCGEADGRLGRIEARLDELAAQIAAIVIPAPVEEVVRDPLDPLGWDSIETAQAALMVLVTQEAARRVGQSVSLYERMVYLDGLGATRSHDEDLELMQHQGWAKDRALVELARLTHVKAIRALTELGPARAYDWKTGWPEE